MSFNIVDVYRAIGDRRKKRKESFKHVLKLCQRQVQNVANKDGLKCLYIIPSIIPGIPLYNVADCAEFVKNELEKSGFSVQQLHSNVLYISWDVEDLEKQNTSPLALEFKSEKDSPDKHMMMNDRENRKFLQDKITSEKTPRKKFVLNLV